MIKPTQNNDGDQLAKLDEVSLNLHILEPYGRGMHNPDSNYEWSNPT